MTDLTKPQPDPRPAGKPASMSDIDYLLNSVLRAMQVSARDTAATAAAAQELSERMASLGVRDYAALLADFRDRVDMLSVTIGGGRDLVQDLLARAQRIKFGAKGAPAGPPGPAESPA